MFLAPAAFIADPELLTRSWTREESLAYTRWLATHHYENFHVVSFLLPKRLHQDFYNVYSFCRWADDLADEIGDTKESLRLLAWWRTELQAMYSGTPKHPVFVALEDTAARHYLLQETFDDLIKAFEQELYRFLENAHPAILTTIKEKKAIDDDLKGKLNSALQEFKARFVQDQTHKAVAART